MEKGTVFHPVYLSDNPSHPFYVVPPKGSGEKNVAGPVQITKNDRRKNAAFSDIQKAANNILKI